MPTPQEIMQRRYKRQSAENMKGYKDRMRTMTDLPPNPMDERWFPYKSVFASRTRAAYIVWAIRSQGGTVIRAKNVLDELTKILKKAGVPEVTNDFVSLGLKLGEEWGWLTRHVIGRRTVAVELHTKHPGLEPPLPGKTRPLIGDTKPAQAPAAPARDVIQRSPVSVASKLDTIHFGGDATTPQTHKASPSLGSSTTPADAARAALRTPVSVDQSGHRLPLPVKPKEPPFKLHREDEFYALLVQFSKLQPEEAEAWIEAVIEQITGVIEAETTAVEQDLL